LEPFAPRNLGSGRENEKEKEKENEKEKRKENESYDLNSFAGFAVLGALCVQEFGERKRERERERE